MFVYEVIPSYIFPLLNGVNIVCLSTQHASSKSRDVITNLFGGIDGNEGLGYVRHCPEIAFILTKLLLASSLSPLTGNTLRLRL
jgi:hypothetical protein